MPLAAVPKPGVFDLANRLVPGTGPIRCTLVSDGLVNQSYRIERNGELYALRRRKRMDDTLGNDPLWEARVLERAEHTGTTPPIIVCDPVLGVLLTRWVTGETWSTQDARAPAVLERMVGLIRSIQATPVPPGPKIMTPRDWCEHYARAMERQDAASGARPRVVGPLREVVEDQLRRYESQRPAPHVLCHSDLHRHNIVVGPYTLTLLDWEYAHIGDAWWDLAGWSSNNDFPAASRLALLERYLGRAVGTQLADELELVAWLHDYVCLLWTELHGEGAGPRARLLAARLAAG